ncbi:CREB3 regulatory factor [Scleropages formosus]|uniref:CREB3 regulatory factor n=1 Tax=Scleropages formosus TaxID=113540 RepID=A0A8C9QUG6_SCLFO|nr:CREB3 regulatory factor-like [Scleropages formosus]
MPQPSISGMDPPFGDAFQNYAFTDQVLTSTDLLASSSDPDFMYELDRDMTFRQSPRTDIFTTGDCKEAEGMEHLEVLEGDPTCNSNFEQWDTYWEDLTKYTKLTSCDIWGTKEVDFLGLDDFSSPYQDEEVIGKTPTLAQLNSEDSQPVCDTLYHPDLVLSQKQNTVSGLTHAKKTSAQPAAPCSSLARGPLPDFAEGSQKATWPVPSSTETISKAQTQPSKVMCPPSDNKDYVRKANVHISTPRRPAADLPSQRANITIKSPFEEGPTAAAASIITAPAAALATATVSVSSGTLAGGKDSEKTQLVVTPENGMAQAASYRVISRAGDCPALLSSGTLATDSSQDKKEEEHNYSLFLTRSKLVGSGEPEQEEPAEGEEEDEEQEEAEDLEADDEDHDEGFGSEHELSENEEEEEDDDDEDYEGDKDDDMSDTFSEPGCDNDAVEDVKGMTVGFSRKRGKRRYFWEYSEQLSPSKQERMLKPSEWDRDTLPSNMYQKNGPHQGKYTVKKSRRTDVEDLTPNPRKLLQIGNELRKLNKVISDLTPVSELPLTARPRSRKEKNKLASRACRLKKKAQYEANKVKLWGLNTEYDRLLFVITAIKDDIVKRVQNLSEDKGTSMAEKLDRLIKETLVNSPVAGQTSDFVNQILENTGGGDPTGGLVGLRVPTSKV